MIKMNDWEAHGSKFFGDSQEGNVINRVNDVGTLESETFKVGETDEGCHTGT